MAFTRTWDAAYEALPTDNNWGFEIDNYIRQVIVDVRERMSVEHEWKNGENDGIHKRRMTLGHISGLVVSNTAEPDNDISISAGECSDKTNAKDIVQSSALVKQIDAVWAVGTNKGGLFSGTVAASTLYYIYEILRSDTGVVDAYFDTSATAENIPANYDYYRMIDWVVTDADKHIIPFNSIGNGNEIEKWFKARAEVAATLAGTSYTVQATTGFIPSGLVCSALFGAITTTVGAVSIVMLSSDGVNAKTVFGSTVSLNAIGEINELYNSGYASPIFVPIVGDNIYYMVDANEITLYLRAVKFWR